MNSSVCYCYTTPPKTLVPFSSIFTAVNYPRTQKTIKQILAHGSNLNALNLIESNRERREKMFRALKSVVSGIGGEGLGLGGAAQSWVRCMSKKRAENLRKINPKVPYPEATSIAQNLYDIFKQHGPLTTSGTWNNAQEAGVVGLQSKTHMKLLLKWMRGKKMLKQYCQHVGSNKKFLLCTPDTLVSEEAKGSAEVKSRSKKSKKKKRVHK